MKIERVDVLGMPLDEWTNKSCVAHIAEGDNWATLYDIQSKEEGKGQATELLLSAKKHYENKGKKLSGSVALNRRMALLYIKCGIEEHKD